MLCLSANKNEFGYGINAEIYAQSLSNYLDKTIEPVSASTFCEARQKLSFEAFNYLLDKSNLEHRNEGRWKGHHVRAVDGSTLVFPHSKEIIQKFPQTNTQGRLQHYPKAKILVATNILTRQPVTCVVQPSLTGEREMLRELVETQFKTGDISVLDKGFEGKRVWLNFEKNNQFFVNRVRQPPVKNKSYINDFLKSGKKDAVTELSFDGEVFKVRLIRGKKLKWGHLIIATNLFNKKKYSRKELLQLYHLRQEVEKTFLFSKPHLRVEKFHSKKMNGVFQEIFCNLLFISMTMGLIYLSKVPINKIASFKWVCLLINRNLPIFILKNIPDKWEVDFVNQVQRFCEPKREQRSYPRHSQQPINPWPMARRPGGWRFRKNGWMERKVA